MRYAMLMSALALLVPTGADHKLAQAQELGGKRLTNVASEVEGESNIIKVLPEGTVVLVGDVICELDSARIRDQAVNQEISVKRAQVDLEQARKNLEVARVALDEYRQGTFPQEEKAALAQLKLAQKEFQVAQRRLERSRKDSSDEDEASPEQKDSFDEDEVSPEQLDFERAKLTVEQAQVRLLLLQKFTGPRTLNELEANIQEARAGCLAKEATYQREMMKQAKLRKQIERCVIKAPEPGVLVYASISGPDRIREGAVVRERQVLFRIVPIGSTRPE